MMEYVLLTMYNINKSKNILNVKYNQTVCINCIHLHNVCVVVLSALYNSDRKAPKKCEEK